MNEDLTTPEVCELAGCSYRQIDYWCRRGVLRPLTPARGQGSHRRWTMHQAAACRVVAQLARMGCQYPLLAAVPEALEWQPELWEGLLVVRADGRVAPVRNLADLATGWVVDAAAAAEHVRQVPYRARVA